MSPARSRIVIKDTVTPRLDLLVHNIQVAVLDTTTHYASQAWDLMRRRVIDATTPTGVRRAAGLSPLFRPRPAWFLHKGPGRIESGAMLASLRWQVGVRGLVPEGFVGFRNAPRYTQYQELGTPEDIHPIPAMLAYARGEAAFTLRYANAMDKALGVAVRSAQRGIRRNAGR